MIRAYWVWGVLVLLYQIYANHYGIRIANAFGARAVTHGGAVAPGLHHK